MFKLSIALRTAIGGLALLTARPAAAGEPPAKVRVTMEAARAMAVAKVQGQILHQELEKEKGRWIYSFEIRPVGKSGRTIKEVNIDAQTGRILPVETERD